LRAKATPERSPGILPTASLLGKWPGGGRRWWAHFESTRINIEPIILRKKIEELMNVRGVGEKNFLKLKPQITVGTPKAEGNASTK
jgi:hypothetical protein